MMNSILFIHPDVKLMKLYEPTLARHFIFDSAHDGLSGLRKIRLNRPHVIVSDYQLPNLSGLGLLKFVRHQPDLITTPFIFLSDHRVVDHALGFGANDWINSAQSSPELLLSKIYQHLPYALHFH